jgi:hypothetical protein
LIQSGNADRVASGNQAGWRDRLVKKDEREHAVEHAGRFNVVLFVLMSARIQQAYQVHDDFAVGMCLEDGGLGERLAKLEVVVDFTVDGEDKRFVLVDERLSSSVYCQPIRWIDSPTPTIARRSCTNTESLAM